MNTTLHFGIRDDDLSFWTDPHEIDTIYAPLFNEGVKVSFATVPKAIKAHKAHNREQFHQDETAVRSLGQNQPLVQYVRAHLALGHVEIMLHGYDHIYYFKPEKHPHIYLANQKNLSLWRAKGRIQWRPECTYKGVYRLLNEIERGKAYLERLLGCEISVYVPPSNQIGQLVRYLPLNLSSAQPGLFDRDLRDGAFHWFKSKLHRATKGFSYPYVVSYRQHQELIAYPLTPSMNSERLLEILEYCHRNQAPFVLATHYWELHQHPELIETMKRLITKAQSLNFKFSFVGEILKQVEKP